MADKIAFFNHKGGVSKTTTAFHLGWMLASKGKRVILADADPQCNLTGLVLGDDDDGYENWFVSNNKRNVKAGLEVISPQKSSLYSAQRLHFQ